MNKPTDLCVRHMFVDHLFGGFADVVKRLIMWTELSREKRQAKLNAAKIAEEQLVLATCNYEAYSFGDLRQVVDTLEAEAKELDNTIKLLQRLWRAKRDEFGKTKTQLHEYGVNMAIAAKKLKATMDANNEAWIGVPDSLRNGKIMREARIMLEGN